VTSPTPYQLLPRLTDDEYQSLKADIAENGIRVPIDVDEDGLILDGHHRAWITADLGVDCPRRTLTGLTDEGKRAHAVAVNVHRRSLSREQRRELVARLRSDGMSLPRIAKTVGVSLGTAHADVQAFSSESLPDRVIGADGKSYAASRPLPAPEPVDEFAGSEWLEPDEDAHPGQSHVLDHTGLETVAPTVTTPTPEPAKAKRRPLPEAFADATRDLKRTAEQLARLTQDDRFTRNRDTTHHQMPELLGALEHAAALVQAMNLPEAPASEEARRWWATSLNTISDTLAGVARSINQEN
jgi:transposase-like protein